MTRPWMDPALPIDVRTELLVSEMTLEECALQLDQPRIDEASAERVRHGIGSVILATSATAGNDAQPASSAAIVDNLQRIAIEETRLGVPLLAARDVIHGHHTVMPIPLAQACSWDAQMVEAGCRAAAVEASADGIRWTFSPMVDVCRDPRWGRVAEGYGESAFLAGEMGAAAVRGYQKNGDLDAPDAIAACAKHIAGYGAAEGGRDYDTAEISVPTLEDVYLPPFRAALVDAKCATVMPTFSAVAGLPAAANAELLTGVLRGRWGFDGVVVTDWNAVAELRDHGIARDGAHAAEQCLKAGSDIDMVSGLFVATLPALAASGDGSVEAALREAARRVVRLKMKLGLFEAPYASRAAPPERTPHLQLARAFAARSSVLLENPHGTLPLRSDARLVVVGPLAEATSELFGTWTLDGIPSEVTSLAAALRAAHAADVQVLPPSSEGSALESALARADVAVAVLGEGPEVSGEAHSLAAPHLPAEQVALLDRLIGAKPSGGVVLVVISGRPLVLPASVDACAAVVWACHPGTEGGRGLADVLLGAAEPGGRLAFTLPRHAGQIPLYHDHKPTGRPLGEYYAPAPRDDAGGFADAGARGRYLDCHGSPRWPFGHGHSFTTFRLSGASVDPPGAQAADEGIRVRCQVLNTGTERPGTTIVQAYVSQPVAELSQPVRRLAGFARSPLLAPGESADIAILLPAHALAYCHRDGSRRVDGGKVMVWLGIDALCRGDGAAGPIEVELPMDGALRF